MSQSGTPASCACGVTGPARGPDAISAGWTCKRMPGGRSSWRCTACTEAARLESRRQHAERLAAEAREREALRDLAETVAVDLGLLASFMLLPRRRPGR